MGVPQDEHDRTLAFAEIALGQIRALTQLASPRNYEIWYHYATGYNPELNQVVNQALEEKGSLSESDLEHIHASYIATNRVNDRLDAVNGRVIDEVKQVLDMVGAAAGSATTYSESLADATEKLSVVTDSDRVAFHHRSSGAGHQGNGAKQQEA